VRTANVCCARVSPVKTSAAVYAIEEVLFARLTLATDATRANTNRGSRARGASELVPAKASGVSCLNSTQSDPPSSEAGYLCGQMSDHISLQRNMKDNEMMRELRGHISALCPQVRTSSAGRLEHTSGGGIKHVAAAFKPHRNVRISCYCGGPS